MTFKKKQQNFEQQQLMKNEKQNKLIEKVC